MESRTCQSGIPAAGEPAALAGTGLVSFRLDEKWSILADAPLRTCFTTSMADEEPVACCVSIEEGPMRIMRTLSDLSMVPLGGDIPNYDLPPDDRKRELVALLAQHDIPLIEDDVYGDLAFGPDRPRQVPAEGAADKIPLQHRHRHPDPAGRYGNCIRLNAALWSERVEQALETVGEMAERAGGET